MSLSLACPSCGARVRAPKQAAGRAFKCPKCGDLLRIPVASSPPRPSPRKATPQMISVICPHCTTKLSLEADSGGSMASCPMCGGSFPLAGDGETPRPQAELDLSHHTRSEEEQEPEAHELEEPEPEEREPEEREPEERVSFHDDDEPWFYGYLEKYAKFLKVEGYFAAAVSAILSTVWFLMFLSEGSSTLSMLGVSNVTMVLVSFLAWLLSLVVIGAMLCLWLVAVAVILLTVDTARNVRAMKQATATAMVQKSGSDR